MTSHQLQFVPQRLREALQEQQITIKAAARALSVSEYTLSRYLNGESVPRPETLRALADCLNKPEAFFFREVVATDGSSVFWRSYAAATKRVRVRAGVLLHWMRETTSYVSQYVELPIVRFPTHHLPALPQEFSSSDIERIAEETRAHWGLGQGPIANVIGLLEHNGAIVSRFNVGAHALDAFSQWGQPEARPYFILTADKSAAVRSRWDAAHELGHMILHRHMDQSLLATPEVHKLVEKQANRFAGAFLLPATTFTRSVFVPTISALLVQKNIWKVSVAAMIMRLRQLRLISEEQMQRLWQNHSRKGMRMKEPMDDTIPPEEAQTLRRAFELLLGEQVLSPDQVLADLALPIEYVQSVANLPLGLLRDRGPEVRLRAPQGRTTVLQFPNRRLQ